MKRAISLSLAVIGILTAHFVFGSTFNPQVGIEVQEQRGMFLFDSKWQGDNPFMANKDGISLGVNIGAATRMVFPKTLDASTPIVIYTRYGEVRQYLQEEDIYQAELSGRYLVYRGNKQSILFRYDQDENAFREFVYLPSAESLKEDGAVIRWRYEGAALSQRQDGSVAFTQTIDPQGDIIRIADQNMAVRIGKFLENQRGTALPDKPIKKTLFVVPPPEYVDGNLSTVTKGLRYETQDTTLTLVLNRNLEQAFPLWVDPTLTADADADVILNGQSERDNFGHSVSSAGDFNGDGKDDVIVGALLDDNTQVNSGSAFIFFGGVTGTVNAGNADVILNGPSASSGANFGWSVSCAGDFNGDGKDDVIVGAPNNFVDRVIFDPGSAYIFFGGRTGTVNAESADVILHGENFDDFFGRDGLSSAGDFNGDGKDDVIVGALGNDTNGSFTGSAYIFFGGVSGTIHAGSANVILRGQSAGDQFGQGASSAGDFNGDGKDDVIVGALANDNTGAESGSAYIFFGGRTGTVNAGNADVILSGQSAGDQFGKAVSSAGDVNGDGKDDVIVTAWADDNTGVNSGSAFIFFGGVTGTVNAGNADVILNGQSAGDLFGDSVSSAGDFNGDGKDDVVVGNYKARQEAGTAYIFLGDLTGGTTINAGNADVILHGQSSPDQFGFSVSSAGDFNGDGKDDVIVGAKLDSNSGPFAGSAFIFFGFLTNQPPVADAGPDQVVEASGPGGRLVNLNASASSDPDVDPMTFTWAGPFPEGGGTVLGLTAQVTVPPGIHTINLLVEDGQGGSDTDFLLVQVVDTTPPVITLLGGTPATVEVGHVYTDAGATASDTVDGDLTSSLVTGGLPVNTNVPDTFSVAYNVSDTAGNAAAQVIRTIQVVNTPPVVTSLTRSSANIDESDGVTLNGTFVDPTIGDIHTVRISWGNGAPNTVITLVSGLRAFEATYPYPDDVPTNTSTDVNVIQVTVEDSAAGVGTNATNVTVNNVPPTVGAISAPIDPVEVGTPITASAFFTDPGALDTHTAEFDWGDTTTSVGAVNPGTREVTGDHTYGIPGVYTVTLTVTDDDTGSSQSIFQFIVVYDPDAGFVTGGGGIDSPAGAYTPDPSLTGQATFGFVSKYKKGTTTPIGQTEFQFKVADLNFHSSTYEWMVVAEAKAIYKGTGTIKGSGNYGFLIFALDEKLTPSQSTDLFRIKIWDKDNGDSVVYDNELGAADDAAPTTAITKGSIVVHKK